MLAQSHAWHHQKNLEHIYKKRQFVSCDVLLNWIIRSKRPSLLAAGAQMTTQRHLLSC